MRFHQFSREWYIRCRMTMSQPPPLEVILFLILLAASLYAFWRRFGPVVATIRHSKVDAGFHLHPAGSRVAKFVWEVLLPAKVIGEPPLPGLAPALLLWRICAFAR